MVALLGISVLIAYACYRVRLVPIVGFVVAGILIGPNAFGIVQDPELVDSLAEVGVILLLFSIGVEFSLEKLARLARAILIGGGSQVLLAVGATMLVLMPFGVAWNAALYTGFLVALSSTAIVLSLLSERNETATPSGGVTLAILVFQDLAIILMVMLVPLLGGGAGSPLDTLWVLGRAFLVIGLTVVMARRVVPFLLERIAQTRRAELFLLTVVAICFGTAFLVSLADISVALGAFLAGLVVSESRYSDQALGEIIPLRTVFNAIFFVSVGMLLDVWFVIENLGLVLLATAAVLVLKFVTTGASVLLLGYPARLAAVVGLGLAQIGEFSFVLERSGAAVGLVPAGVEAGSQAFLAVTVLLMIATPFLVRIGPAVGALVEKSPLRRFGKLPELPAVGHGLEDHVVIVGFGPAGRRLAQVLARTGIPFCVVEFNPALREETPEVAHVVYGDATRAHVLEAAGIHTAKLCAVVINDSAAAFRITELAKALNPTVQAVVRTRFLDDVERLHRAGADIVVPEEMETTVRVFSHVLGAYLVPPDVIEEQARLLRAGDYQVLRGSIQEAHLMVLQGLDEDGLHTRAVMVRDGAFVAGKTLAELELRLIHRLTVLAVRRGARTFGNPAGAFKVEVGDRLVMIGSARDFADSAGLFRPPQAEQKLEV